MSNATIKNPATSEVVICESWQIEELCSSGIIVPVDQDDDDAESPDTENDYYSIAMQRLN